MTLADIRAGWNRFFHEPAPATTLGVWRICYGLLLLAYAALISTDLLIWYGDKGVLSLETSKLTPGGSGFNLMHLFPHSDAGVQLFFGIFLVAAF